MSTELFIARRISLRPSSGRRSTGVVIAVTGVALAMTVMLVSVAVMLGFKHEIREKVMGFDAQLSVVPFGNDGDGGLIDFSPAMRGAVDEVLPDGAKVNPVMVRPAILKTEDDFAGVIVKGVEAGNGLPFIAASLTEGAIPDYGADSTRYHVVISDIMARKLNLGAGDRLTAYFTEGDGARARKLTVAGVYDTHFSDYDKTWIFGSIDMLRRLAKAADSDCSAIEISGLGSDENIDATGSELSRALSMALYRGEVPQMYAVENIHRTAALYFNWLALLDTNVVVIIVMMALVSGLTLISSLFIIVLERVNMIGVLKAVGASNALIRRTFIILAERLVASGLLIGNALGLGFILVQKYLQLIPLSAESYYLDFVPVQLDWWWILALNAGTVAMAALVLIVPTRIIATISPVKAIRFD